MGDGVGVGVGVAPWLGVADRQARLPRYRARGGHMPVLGAPALEVVSGRVAR